jgi:hypothetical protein
VFGLKRGMMINCVLCPKKGGAMKPTNILSRPYPCSDKKLHSQSCQYQQDTNQSSNSLNQKRGATRRGALKELGLPQNPSDFDEEFKLMMPNDKK